MTTFTGPPSDAIRNKPISEELKLVLDTAARAAGVDTIRITSGGQDTLGEGTRRTGSTRHDGGRAADLGYNSAKGLKQGFFDGEKIFDFVGLSWTVEIGRALSPGLYVVVARGGLKLRGGPGTNFDSERTLPAGTEVNVVESDSQDPSWVRVDLEGDSLLDGYVFASFLAPAEQHVGAREDVPEPA